MSARENSRAVALRRHWRNPFCVEERKRTIRAAMVADLPAKTAASLAGVSVSVACKWARVLGFRLMYVTASERAAILSMRAAGSKARAA